MRTVNAKANRKRIIFWISILCFALTVCGCSGGKERKAEDYLQKRYQRDFEFVNYGDSSWSSKYTSYQFQDPDGNTYYVREYPAVYTDNYQAVLFDPKICGFLQEQYGNEIKAFANTKSHYLYGTVSKSASEYIEKLPYIDILIFTTEWSDREEWLDAVMAQYPSGKVNLLVHEISENAYRKMNNAYSVSDPDIYHVVEYSVENGKLRKEYSIK